MATKKKATKKGQTVRDEQRALDATIQACEDLHAENERLRGVLSGSAARLGGLLSSAEIDALARDMRARVDHVVVTEMLKLADAVEEEGMSIARAHVLRGGRGDDAPSSAAVMSYAAGEVRALAEQFAGRKLSVTMASVVPTPREVSRG